MQAAPGRWTGTLDCVPVTPQVREVLALHSVKLADGVYVIRKMLGGPDLLDFPTRACAQLGWVWQLLYAPSSEMVGL
jgi:hypothetical protein